MLCAMISGRGKDFLPGRKGHVGGTAADNRLFVDAVIYRYRMGIPWRDLPERYGQWKPTHRRYRRWCKSGVFARIFETLAANNAEEIHRKYTLDAATGEAIELYRNCTRYITVSGLTADLPPCPVLDVVDGFFERLQFRLDVLAQSRVLTPGFDFNLNNAGPQQVDYGNLIQNGADEGERSEEFARVVWHLAGQGKSAEEIVQEIARHPAGIGQKYAGRLQVEVDRSYAKWQMHRRNAAIGSPAVAGTPWPQIRIIPGELPRVVNEAEDALRLLGREVYQFGGMLVRPQLVPIRASADREFQGWRMVPITWPYLIELFSCAARFLKYDRRKQDFVQTDVSRLVVSGVLCKWDGQAFPPVPPQPTKEDARAALAELEKPLTEFPFETRADKAAALSAILTALDRRGMDVAPLHAFTAPAAGTGKGLLVDIIASLPPDGRCRPSISPVTMMN
jgi:transposase